MYTPHQESLEQIKAGWKFRGFLSLASTFARLSPSAATRLPPCAPQARATRAFALGARGSAPTQVLAGTSQAGACRNRLDFGGTSSIAVSVAEALKRRPPEPRWP
jgi:hypothetical protein